MHANRIIAIDQATHQTLLPLARPRRVDRRPTKDASSPGPPLEHARPKANRATIARRPQSFEHQYLSRETASEVAVILLHLMPWPSRESRPYLAGTS
jgi:hypothetical protein